MSNDEIERLRSPTEWRPISEAPDDDRDVLLYCRDSGEQMVGFFRKQDVTGTRHYQFASGPKELLATHICTPTHYMTLPLPPGLEDTDHAE